MSLAGRERVSWKLGQRKLSVNFIAMSGCEPAAPASSKKPLRLDVICNEFESCFWRLMLVRTSIFSMARHAAALLWNSSVEPPDRTLGTGVVCEIAVRGSIARSSAYQTTELK